MSSRSNDPATATTLVAVVDGNVIFADFLTRTFVSIPLNTYITQTGSQPPTGIVPISTLVPAIQRSLTGTANPGMVNSPALQVPPSQPLTSLVVGTIACAYLQSRQDPAALAGLALPAPEFAGTIQSMIVGGACGGGGGLPPGGGATGGGTPSSVGRDRQVCGTQPCS